MVRIDEPSVDEMCVVASNAFFFDRCCGEVLFAIVWQFFSSVELYFSKTTNGGTSEHFASGRELNKKCFGEIRKGIVCSSSNHRLGSHFCAKDNVVHMEHGIHIGVVFGFEVEPLKCVTNLCLLLIVRLVLV